MNLQTLIARVKAQGSAKPSVSPDFKTHTVPAGLVPGSPFIVFGNGTELGRATVDSLGKGLVILTSAPAVGVALTYSEIVTGSIVGALGLTITGTPPNATVGTAYSWTPTVSGGGGVKTFSLIGTLLAGWSFSSTTGTLSASPGAAGIMSGLAITVSDTSGAEPATLTGITINVLADTTPPVINTPATQTVAENVPFGLVLSASEPVTWAKTGGADAALFTLNTSSGALSLPSQDFENATHAPSYQVQVTATDASGNTAAKMFTLAITNVPETGALTINPANTTIPSSSQPGSLVTTVSGLTSGSTRAFVPNDGQFVLVGDQVQVGSTPLVAGRAAPVLREINGGEVRDTTLTISVSAPADTTPPIISTSPNQTVPENQAFSLTLVANETVTWTKTGGADAALFVLSGSILSLTPRDFEVPTDANGDNVYVVQVTATDTAGNATAQTISLTVTDVVETTALPMLKSSLAATQANTKQTRILWFGGDDVVGLSPTNLTQDGKANSAPGKLASSFGSAGSIDNWFGFQNANATNPYASTQTTFYDGRLVTSCAIGGPSQASLGHFTAIVNASGHYVQFSPTKQVDTIEVYTIRDSLAGVCDMQCNGASIGSLVRSGATVNGLNKTTFTVPKGQNVFKVAWTSGYNTIVGMIAYDSTVKDIQVINLGVAYDGLATTWKSDLYYSTGWANTIGILNADLAIIQQNNNDTQGSKDRNTIKALYGNIIQACRTSSLDVIGVTAVPQDTAVATAQQQTNYVNDFKLVFGNLGVKIIDLAAYLVSYAQQSGAGRMSSVRYPNATGYAYIASYVKAQIDSFLTGAPSALPAPQTYQVTSLAAALALDPPPGSSVLFQRSATPYAGSALTTSNPGYSLHYTGTAELPVKIGTYGPTDQQAIITGTPTTSFAVPNYVNALVLTSSNVVVDGGVVDGGKMGLVFRNSGRAGIWKEFGTFNHLYMNIECANVGAAVVTNGLFTEVVHSYFHDLIMVKNTYGGPPSTQVPGEPNAFAWDDDDYGGNGVIFQGSFGRMSHCLIVRDKSDSYDYISDGGAIELFVQSGATLEDIWVHDCIIRDGDGVIEGGGSSTGSGNKLKNIRVNGILSINNGTFIAVHNSGGNFEGIWEACDWGYNTIVDYLNVRQSRQQIVMDGNAAAKIAGFASPYGLHDSILYMNDGDAIFKQTEQVSHRNNLLWMVTNPSNVGTAGVTHLYNDWSTTLASGETIGNPQFVDMLGGDFSLQSGSPGAGKGHTGWTKIPRQGYSSCPTDYAKPPLAVPTPNRQTSKVFRPGGSTGGTGITHASIHVSDAPFQGGYLILSNTTNTAQTVSAVSVAVSSVENDGFNPLNSAGAAGTWVDLAGPYTIPAAPVPGTGGVPGTLRIPFNINSIARTDTTTWPHILMVRVRGTTVLTPASPTADEMNAQATYFNGKRPNKGWWKAGDFTSTNKAGFTSPAQAYIEPIAVVFRTTVAGKTILFPGDSTHQGALPSGVSGSNYLSYGILGADLMSTLTKPVYAENCGFQGMTTPQVIAAARGWLAAQTAHYVCIPVWSINDGSSTQAAADANYDLAEALAKDCVASGIVPIFVTGLPASSASAGADTIRKNVNARAIASGRLFFDYSAVYGDGASPERLAPTGSTTTDGTHLSDYVAAAQAFNTKFASIINP